MIPSHHQAQGLHALQCFISVHRSFRTSIASLAMRGVLVCAPLSLIVQLRLQDDSFRDLEQGYTSTRQVNSRLQNLLERSEVYGYVRPRDNQ